MYSWVPTGPPQQMQVRGGANVTAAGPLLWEVQQHVNDFVMQSIRLVSGVRGIEVQTRVGPLPASTSQSVTSRWSTAIRCNGTFTTDSNAFQRMTRRADASTLAQGRTYPVVGSVGVSNGSQAAALVSGRPVGATAVVSSDGGCAVEVMLHRRLIDSDHRGNDTTIIDDPMLLLVGETEGSVLDLQRERSMAHTALRNAPEVRFAAVVESRAKWLASHRSTWAPLATSLPDGVHLVSLGRLDETEEGSMSVGLRLQRLPGWEVGAVVDVAALLGGATGLNLTTPDFLLPVDQPPRYPWPCSGVPIKSRAAAEQRAVGASAAQARASESVSLAPTSISSMTASITLKASRTELGHD